MKVDVRITKRALIRENDSTPIGQPGKLYINCGCGNHLSMPDGVPIVMCVCGQRYDADGWLRMPEKISEVQS